LTWGDVVTDHAAIIASRSACFDGDGARRKRGVAVLVITALVAALLAAVQFASPPVAKAAASTGSINLKVQTAATIKNVSTAGTPITNYKWMINEDDTGNPGTVSNQGTQRCLPPSAGSVGASPADANTYADHCPWPSVRPTDGWTKIVAQGDQSDLSTTKTLDNLPNGKYLISVTADGYKIDGAHFTVNGDTQQVNVGMYSNILPLTTLRLQVFQDNMPVDATYEVDAESGANMSGFTATLTDVLGLVSTDYYGNPLCTTYLHGTTRNPNNRQFPILFDANGKPEIDPNSTGKCVSDRTGLIVIPNLGPNRYAATITRPSGTDWIQTTTLEGGHDHDIWQQEGETGYDTEQLKGAELVPSTQFGFVHQMTLAASATDTSAKGGEIKGNAIAGLPYVGGNGGQTDPDTNLAGVKDGGPIPNAWIALSDLDHNDVQVYAQQADANGHFDIKNVAAGSYQLSIWDFDQDYILYSFNVTVDPGQTNDVGNQVVFGWFTHVYGTVFIDSNGNGRRDPGEQGVPRFTMTVRERDNSLMDQATNAASTNDSGDYNIRETYPMGKFLVLEGFNTGFKTTGITYQGENDPSPTTQLGSMVDINFLPIIGLGGRIDWGVQPYDKKQNGGIVGTVTYDTTRNELDPQYAATEAYQPGIPGVPVHLYLPQKCTETDPDLIKSNCRQGYELNSDGSIAKVKDANGDPIPVQDTYTSEEWAAPRGCTARQWDGSPLAPGTDQQALPPQGTDANALCVEAPMAAVATGVSDAANGGQTVNGNYGFSTSKINLLSPSDPQDPTVNGQPLDQYAPLHCLANPSGSDPARDSRCADGSDYNFDDQPLGAQDYLVGVEIPNDPVDGKPMYRVTSEEDVNIFSGDRYLPQENFPPVSVASGQAQAGNGVQPIPAQPPSQQAGIVSPCAGPLHTVHVTNADFLAGGGSPFEGQARPSCVDKLVNVRSGQATAPNFNLFTDVPMPTHFWGLTLNDLGITLDKRSVNYGEAQGLPYVPVGLYDWAGRLDYTAHTDYNGLYEALMPSTDTYNCPVPAGPCPNMYRFVGNDPGQPGALNPDYNPRFRTIATNFQAWPGLYTVTDEAPTQVAATALAPDTTTVNPTQCDLGATGDKPIPQLLAVDRPYLRSSDGNRTLVIKGMGFGSVAGTVTLGGANLTAPAWTDTQITVTVPTTAAVGAQSLAVTRADGTSGYNMLTEQIVNGAAANAGTSSTNPRIVEVGPGVKSVDAYRRVTTIQAAMELASPSRPTPYWLVVVYPNTPTSANPRGEYTENVIFHHRVHLQGVGPGGFQPDGTFVPGSIIDGSGFNPDNPSGLAWVLQISRLRYSGNPAVPDAAVVTVLDDPSVSTSTLPSSWNPTIDGFQITGGAQADFPGNINNFTGGVVTPYGANGALISQGGGIYVHSHVRNLQITDNLITGNGGSYGGAIRVGTPYLPTSLFSPLSNQNTGVTIRNNQIRDNGGTNLAGGIGIFNGSDSYSIDHNAICGNHSAEYGGAITAFGYQEAANTAPPGGSITRNRIWFNQSYDEGGAVMIAGELPASATALTPGTGRVTIDRNIIQANLANDDGGGIRLLQVAGSNVTSRTAAQSQAIQITNNVIASNVSAHEGGGIALDDAPFTNVVNNTIANNVTTATAVTSNGQPAPAGLSTANNSDALNARLATLGGGFPSTNIDTLKATTWSKPTLLNDVFWDNRAGSFDGSGGVCGIGSPSCTTDPTGVNNWDMGVADNSAGYLSPTHSVIQDGTDVAPGPDGAALANTSNDPQLKDQYHVDVNILAFRGNPAFRQALIVAQLLPPRLMGDYHLTGSGSSAYGLGARSTTTNWGAWVPAAPRNPAHWTGWSYGVSAPTTDIDGDTRPSRIGSRDDAGADQATP
jgi:hypothetical protein